MAPTFAAAPLLCPPRGPKPPKGGLSEELSAPTFAAAPLLCPPRGPKPPKGGLSES